MDDTDLLSKIIITGGDLHAADQVYHKSCHTKYHTQVRSQQRKKSKSDVSTDCLSTQAIHAVIRQMDRLQKSEGCFIFELEDIYSSYKEFLEDFNENKTKSPMNGTRFKEKLVDSSFAIREHKQ